MVTLDWFVYYDLLNGVGTNRWKIVQPNDRKSNINVAVNQLRL